MPIVVRDTTYELPNSDGRNGVTGAEIDAVEVHFGVDWFDLMATLDREDKDEDGKPIQQPPSRPGCTRNRAVYAIAWVAMHRVDPAVTLDSVMADYAANELQFVSEEPAKKGKAAALPTPAGDEATEPAVTS